MPAHDPSKPRRMRHGWTPEKIAAARDYPHGTSRGYDWGCSCVPCRKEGTRQSHLRELKRTRGEAGLVSAEPTRLHLVMLRERHGVVANTVGKMVGVMPAALHRVLDGRVKTVLWSTEKAVLALTWEQVWAEGPATATVSSKRSTQQYRSMQRLGYTGEWLSRELGYKEGITAPGFIGQSRPTLSLGMARKVDALARRVGDRRGPCEQSAHWAKTRGYHVPGAYDDLGNLIPGAARTEAYDLVVAVRDAQTVGAKPGLSAEVEAEIVAAGMGVTARVIAERLGVTPGQVAHVRSRYAGKASSAA